MKKSSYEGLQKDVRSLKTPAIEVWENRYHDKKYVVKMEVAEFTCLCPKTGLPDFAALNIEYIPDKWCLELKSFKNYIFSFRNVGIFHENVINRIFDDIVKICQPRWIKVGGVFNVRGGIRTTVGREMRFAKKR